MELQFRLHFCLSDRDSIGFSQLGGDQEHRGDNANYAYNLY